MEWLDSIPYWEQITNLGLVGGLVLLVVALVVIKIGRMLVGMVMGLIGTALTLLRWSRPWGREEHGMDLVERVRNAAPWENIVTLLVVALLAYTIFSVFRRLFGAASSIGGGRTRRTQPRTLQVNKKPNNRYIDPGSRKDPYRQNRREDLR